nr:hypothetical protein [Candidatus Njordarchaeota archaeon]
MTEIGEVESSLKSIYGEKWREALLVHLLIGLGRNITRRSRTTRSRREELVARHRPADEGGTLTTPQGRELRFYYMNKDAEQRNRVAESLTNAFGKTNTKYVHHREYGKDRFVTGTLPEVTGHALRGAGATTHEVARQDPEAPAFILQGSKEMNREYLK